MKAKVKFKNPIMITTLQGRIECNLDDVIEVDEDNLRALVRASIVEPIEEVIEVEEMQPEASEEVTEASNQDIEPKFIKEQTEEKKTRKKRGTK